jgi:hypothetical protein
MTREPDSIHCPSEGLFNWDFAICILHSTHFPSPQPSLAGEGAKLEQTHDPSRTQSPF